MNIKTQSIVINVLRIRKIGLKYDFAFILYVFHLIPNLKILIILFAVNINTIHLRVIYNFNLKFLINFLKYSTLNILLKGSGPSFCKNVILFNLVVL